MICVYDNPVNWHRECWQDGKMIYSVSAEMLLDLLDRKEHAPIKVFMGINLLEDWKPGQYFGDKKAIGSE